MQKFMAQMAKGHEYIWALKNTAKGKMLSIKKALNRAPDLIMPS